MPHAIAERPHPCITAGANYRGLFQASLANPAPPSIIATKIREIIESGTWKLRHPCGPDAEPFLAWRASMTDEQWVDFNALDAAGIPGTGKARFRPGPGFASRCGARLSVPRRHLRPFLCASAITLRAASLLSQK